MGTSFESYVAFHCAPTLAGIKQSNLFTWHHVKKGGAEECVADLRKKFTGSDLSVEILCQCEHYTLILVYRENMLNRTINRPEVRNFLSDFGYTEDLELPSCLEKLKSRIVPRGAFPHEIGVFLGYPLHDVAGFISSPEKRCALSGEWKVYENESEASKIFERFKKCRADIYQRFTNGSGIADLMA